LSRRGVEQEIRREKLSKGRGERRIAADGRFILNTEN
jgi:hypothetical protein